MKKQKQKQLSQKDMQYNYFVWTIMAIITTGLCLWGYITYQAIKTEQEMIVSIPVVKGGVGDELDVSGWQTYRNEEAGFSIKYPLNWHILLEADKIATFASFSELAHGGVPPAQGVMVVVAKGICNEPIDEFKDELFASEFTRSYKRVCIQDFQISLEYDASSIDRNADELLLKTIAETFEIIWDISEWKTYRNEETGLSFHYPNNYKIEKVSAGMSGGEGWLDAVRIYLRKYDDRRGRAMDCGGYVLQPDEIDIYIVEYKKITTEDTYPEIPVGEITLGENIMKVKREIGGMCATDDSFYWHMPGKTSVGVSVSPSESQYMKEAEKILSTFKFIPLEN